MDWPSTLPPCRIIRGVVDRVAAAGADHVGRMWGEMSEQRWIPVSERLPEDGDWVLWFNKSWSCPVLVARRDGDSLDWGGDFCHTLHGFTHWMPLPEPPNCTTQPREGVQ
jgi:hypothetical protein